MKPNAGRQSLISFYFNEETTITESYIPGFSLATYFADLGGSLGLWLGVGAVQLLGYGLSLISLSKKLIKV